MKSVFHKDARHEIGCKFASGADKMIYKEVSFVVFELIVHQVVAKACCEPIESDASKVHDHLSRGENYVILFTHYLF